MKDWFEGLQPRERVIVLIGAAFVLLTFVYVAIIGPLYGGVATRATQVAEKEQLLAWMNAMAEQKKRAGNANTRARRGGGGPPILVFGQAASNAGLKDYLKQTQPTSNQNGVRARFEGVPFDDLVQLLGRLYSGEGMRTTTAALERSTPSGTIDARLTVERPGT